MFDLTKIISEDAAFLGPDATIGEGVELLLDSGQLILPVVDDGRRVVGIMTEKMFLQSAGSGKMCSDPIGECMNTNFVGFNINMGLIAVMYRVIVEKLREVPVTDGGVLVGILNRGDLLEYLMDLKKCSAEMVT